MTSYFQVEGPFFFSLILIGFERNVVVGIDKVTTTTATTKREGLYVEAAQTCSASSRYTK